MKPYETLFSSGSQVNNMDCGVIHGNSVDMNIQKDDCEIRADIVVSRVNNIRIWGQVKDCDGVPISMALVKLIKPININGIIEYKGIGHTLTDCSGFYQIDVAASEMDNKYKIIVSKASVEGERIVNGGNCKACPPPPCPPSCPPPPPPPSPCPPTQQKIQYQANESQKMQYKQSDIQEHTNSYSPEPMHNSFYGEPLNKSNIFKKNE